MKRAENSCDDALEISLKYVPEYPPPHNTTFKKMNTDKKIKKVKVCLLRNDFYGMKRNLTKETEILGLSPPPPPPPLNPSLERG